MRGNADRRGRRARAAVLAGVAAASLSCGNPGDTDPPLGTQESAAWNAAAQEWDRRFDAGDVAGLAALYAEDVVSMPFDAPTIHGRENLRAELERFFAGNRGRHETLVEETLATDDWAIERASYVVTYAPLSGGPEVRETGRHVVCRKKRNGVWEIAWELWNTDTPPR